MKNGIKVIDAHSHIFPEKIVAKAVANTDSFYGTSSVRIGTVSDIINHNNDAGVDQSIICSVATTEKQVKAVNDFIAKTVSNYPDKFIGLGSLYPGSAHLEDDFAYLVSLGLVGIKLHPDIQQFKVDDSRCLEIYKMCEKAGIPVLLHTGDNRYDNSNPSRLIKVLETFPNVIFIGAHFGYYSSWINAPSAYVKFNNMYVDSSSSFAFLTKDEIKRLVAEYGANKILFGSDYPMWDAKNELSIFDEIGLSKEEYEKIFHGNAEKIYYPLINKSL